MRALSASGVRAILVPAVAVVNWPHVVACAAAWGDPHHEDLSIYYALGVHPWQVKEACESAISRALDHLSTIDRTRESRWRAIGECGLDYAHASQLADRSAQVRIFRRQLQLARFFGMPLTIHCVKAFGALLQAIDEIEPPPSVVHGFSGDANLARELLRRGHYLGFGGILTSDRARRVVSAVQACPADRLLLETDDRLARAWTTPTDLVPRQSELVLDIARRVAEIRQSSLAEISTLTWSNAQRLFGRPSGI